MTDIVEQMRAYADESPIKDTGAWIDFASLYLAKGADEIERLRAALEPFTCVCEDQCMADAEWASPPAKPSADICAHFAARAALGGDK